MIKIHIAKDFSQIPGDRWLGRKFREEFLEQHFKDINNNEVIEIDFDGTYGYSSNFLQEIFGVLSLKYGKEKIKKRFKFISEEEPLLLKEIDMYIEQKEF